LTLTPFTLRGIRQGLKHRDGRRQCPDASWMSSAGKASKADGLSKVDGPSKADGLYKADDPSKVDGRSKVAGATALRTMMMKRIEL